MLLRVKFHALGDCVSDARHRHNPVCAVGFQAAAVAGSVVGEFYPRLLCARLLGVIEHVRNELREVVRARHVVCSIDVRLADRSIRNSEGVRAQRTLNDVAVGRTKRRRVFDSVLDA